jgi:predicted phosphodiesterase
LRYGLISDIHGNMHALEATLDALAHLDVTDYLCAGDLVGYGPMPNECVAAIAGLDARCVAGNHDLIAVGRLPDGECSQLAQDSLRWTSARLDPIARRYLERLPSVLATPDGVVVAHGSLGDPSEYVREPGQRIEQLRRLEQDHPGASVLVLGHTHRRAAHSAQGGTIAVTADSTIRWGDGDRLVLNPGSVGQSRDRSARARFMVLDADRDEATFYTVRYDVRGCRRALRRQGLPTHSHHLRRSAVRTSAERLRRAVPGVAAWFARGGD